MVNLGDDTRWFRILRLETRPSYMGWPNTKETAHFLSKSTASPDPDLFGMGPTMADLREGVSPRPTLERGPPPSPEGPHSARSDRTPGNGERPR